MATTFGFSFDPRFAPLLRVWGASPARAEVVVDDERLRARFGIFRLSTPLSNIAEASVTGPHKPYRALGVRMSATDRGLTLGSSAERMVCMKFHRPVRMQPFDVVAHPGLSVSVDRPDELAALLNGVS